MCSRDRLHNRRLRSVCLRNFYATTVSVARLPGTDDNPHLQKSLGAHILIDALEESHSQLVVSSESLLCVYNQYKQAFILATTNAVPQKHIPSPHSSGSAPKLYSPPDDTKNAEAIPLAGIRARLQERFRVKEPESKSKLRSGLARKCQGQREQRDGAAPFSWNSTWSRESKVSHGFFASATSPENRVTESEMTSSHTWLPMVACWQPWIVLRI